MVVCDGLMMVGVSNDEERSVFLFRDLFEQGHCGVHMQVGQDMMTRPRS